MTWTCWAVVSDKEVYATGDNPEYAKEMYFHDCTWRGQQKPWEWHVEQYGVRVVRLECKEVDA